MNKVNKSAVVKGRELVFSSDTNFASYEKRYPLNDVLSSEYTAKVSRQDGFILIFFDIKAKLQVFDTRDNALFNYDLKTKEDVEIVEDEDRIEEGLYIAGPSIDLDELALGIIHSSLPLRLVRNNKKETINTIKGVNLLEEDDVENERSNFSLDDLPDFPSKDDK